MFFTCEVWCKANVSSVGSSSKKSLVCRSEPSILSRVCTFSRHRIQGLLSTFPPKTLPDVTVNRNNMGAVNQKKFVVDLKLKTESQKGCTWQIM